MVQPEVFAIVNTLTLSSMDRSTILNTLFSTRRACNISLIVAGQCSRSRRGKQCPARQLSRSRCSAKQQGPPED